MRATIWLPILVWVGLLCAGAQEGGVEPVILAQEQAWIDAQSRGDNAALDRIFDAALVYIEDRRLVTKGEYLSRVRHADSHPQIAVGAMTVHLFGSTAIVVGTYRETGTHNGTKLLRQWRFIDTWVNKKGIWMLVAAGAAPLSK
jgi:hypothetical protein